MDDGPDLSKLIIETRKLATENAEFCEIHAQQNNEIQKLKSANEELTSKNDRLQKEIVTLKHEIAEKHNTETQRQNSERDLKNKLRVYIEENRVKSEELAQMEEKFCTISATRTELDSRYKISRTEIQNLRNQIAELATERDGLQFRLTSLQEASARQKAHTKTLCLELDHLSNTRESNLTQLNETKIELNATQEQLDSAKSEIERQKSLLDEIDKMKTRLSMSENKNANFEAEISQMNGRLKALAEQNEDLLGDQQRKEENARKKDEFVEKLKTDISKLQEEKSDFQAVITTLEKTVQANEKLINESERNFSQQEINFQKKLSQMTKDNQRIISQYDDQISQFRKISMENENTISSTETELQEILSLNQKKEQQLTSQFQKIENLITLNTEQEMSLMSLKNHAEEMKAKIKELTDHKNRLHSEQNRSKLDSAQKDTSITLLNDQLETGRKTLPTKANKKATNLENENEELKIQLGKSSSFTRKAENKISHLTAEQARYATQLSQLKRKQEETIRERDESNRNEKRLLKNEYESIIGEMELLKNEWQSRAKKAEENLVKIIRKYDDKVADCQRLEKNLENNKKVESSQQFSKLLSINRQQSDLVDQNRLFLKQWNLNEKLKKFLRETVIELNKKNRLQISKWKNSTPILRFRKIVIVVLAARRLTQKFQPFQDFGIISSEPHLVTHLRFGLFAILSKYDIIQLYSTRLLAANLQQGIQNTLDKSNKFEREKTALRHKLKSSTSFITELETRVQAIESKENF